MTWVAYDAAESPCSSGPQPGTAALAAALMDTFAPDAFSKGIYNCREVGGGGAWSLHSDGRAFDLGLPMVGGRAIPLGHTIVARIKDVAASLGIMECIYDRTRWSASYPDGRWYGGESPHFDHIHIGQSWAGALHLTYDTAMELLKGSTYDDPGHTPTDPEDDMTPQELETAVRNATAGSVGGTIEHLDDLEPGETRTIVAPPAYGATLRTGAVFLAIAWGDNQPGTEKAKLFGKQLRGADDHRTIGLWAAGATWENEIPPRTRVSAQLLADCDAVLIRNDSPHPVSMQFQITPRYA